MRVLVLEASTSAAKALVYDDSGGIVAEDTATYSPDIDAGGRQDARGVRDATMTAGRRAVEKAGGGRGIGAVGVSGVWHSIIPCDADMKPVERSCIWSFTGPGELCREFRRRKDEAADIYRRTGCMPNITYQPYALLHLKKSGFDPAGKLFASQAGFNFHHLTGERLESKCITSGMGFLNTHRLVYDEGILDLVGIEADQLGGLVDYREHRPLRGEAAAELGVEPGIPVVPPHSDGALNQLGNGCMRTGTMTFSVGTSAAIRISTDRPVLSDPPGTWCYVGVEGWISGAATNGACNCVNWFKETVLENRWTFDALGGKLIDAGSSPVFLPFLFGERCPGWDDNRRGGFVDMDGTTDVRAMFRGLSEGVLFNIYHCYRILTALAGVPAAVIMSGGILNSPKWTQMAADIFQREISLSHVAQASLLGGAAVALHAAGALPDFVSFCPVNLEKVAPRPGAAKEYERKFDRYLEWYERER